MGERGLGAGVGRRAEEGGGAGPSFFYFFLTDIFSQCESQDIFFFDDTKARFCFLNSIF